MSPSLYLFWTAIHLTWQIRNQIENPTTNLIRRQAGLSHLLKLCSELSDWSSNIYSSVFMSVLTQSAWCDRVLLVCGWKLPCLLLLFVYVKDIMAMRLIYLWRRWWLFLSHKTCCCSCRRGTGTIGNIKSKGTAASQVMISAKDYDFLIMTLVERSTDDIDIKLIKNKRIW